MFDALQIHINTRLANDVMWFLCTVMCYYAEAWSHKITFERRKTVINAQRSSQNAPFQTCCDAHENAVVKCNAAKQLWRLLALFSPLRHTHDLMKHNADLCTGKNVFDYQDLRSISGFESDSLFFPLHFNTIQISSYLIPFIFGCAKNAFLRLILIHIRLCTKTQSLDVSMHTVHTHTHTYNNRHKWEPDKMARTIPAHFIKRLAYNQNEQFIDRFTLIHLRNFL